MDFEMVPLDSCPACGGINWLDCIYVITSDMEREKTGVRELKYVVCQCGLMFAEKYFRDTDSYYRSFYRVNIKTPLGEVSEDQLAGEYIHGKTTLSEIVKRLGSVDRAMDIGSSAGLLLSQIGERYGCELQGVELSEAYRKYSTDHGIPVTDVVENTKGEFDLITIVHVLEHTIDPVGFLKSAMSKGNDRTTYAVVVPFFNPRINHPLLLTASNLRDLLERAGLEIFDTVLAEDITVFARRASAERLQNVS